MENPQLSLIFPAYNEARRIAAVAYLNARRLTYEIIVVADDEDGTREIVAGIRKENPSIVIMGGPERRGKGHGIRMAASVARGEVIGFADADDKTPISELDKILPHLEDGWDIVIGSRGKRESVIERPQPWYRQVGSRGFGLFMHTVVGLWDIVDTQCGFKFFRGPVARDLFAQQVVDGYMFDVEVLYLARRSGYRIQQVPVRWRDDGDSRLDLVAGNLQNFLDMLRIRFGNTTRQSRSLAGPTQ